MFPSLRSGVFACSLVALSACGGGGGGSNGGGGSRVQVALTSPTNIVEEVYEGGPMRTVTLVGMASGDVASLAGRTIYIIVVDPDGLFQANPLVSLAAGNQVNVILAGAVQAVPRHVAGSLTVNVCLDAACAQPLGGSPLHLPYDVTVRPGINVDGSPMAVGYRFGDVPAIRSFAVGLPSNLTNFVATAVENDGFSPSNYAVAEAMQTGGNGLVTVTFTPAVPGVYTGKIRIDVTLAGPQGAMAYRKDIPFTYTVTDNAAVLAFYYPSQVAVVVSGSSTTAKFPNLTLLSRPGVSMVSSVMEYLTWEPMAADHPNVNGWMSLFPVPALGACFFNNGMGSPPDCLPTGLYTARVHTLVTDGVQQVDVYVPVAMTVVP